MARIVDRQTGAEVPESVPAGDTYPSKSDSPQHIAGEWDAAEAERRT